MLIQAQFKQIALHALDSYTPNGYSVARLDGSVCMNGENGVGKTSFIKLLPLFFGEKPSSIAKKSGGNQSFIDYYLPRSTSYLIFEYERLSEPCMVILYANDKSLNYRFCKAAFDPAFFINADQSIVPSNEIYAHLQRMGVDISKQITSTHDYKEIIQNLGSAERDLRQKYSFCTARNNLRHIEKIITGMFKRATKFDDLRAIIISCIESNQNTEITLDIKKEELESWISDVGAAKFAEQGRPFLSIMQQAATRKRNAESDLCAARAWFDRELRSVADRSKEINKESKELVETIATVRANHNTGVEAASALCRTARELALDKLSEITNIDKKKASFDQQDALAKKTDLATLPSIEEECSQRAEKITLLETKSEQAILTFKDMTHDAQQRVSLQSATIDESRMALMEQAGEQKDALAQRIAASRADINESHQKLIDADGARHASAISDVRVLDAQLASAAAPQELLDTLAQRKSAQATLSESLNDLQSQRKTAQDVLNKSIAERDQFIIAHKARELGVETCENAIVAARKALESSADTFSGFLRANVPDWAESIGKTINPALLSRNDLNPKVTSDVGSGSMYGIKIDLSSLPECENSDEALQERLDLLQAKLPSLIKDVESALVDIKNTAGAIKDATAALAVMDAQIETAQRAYQQSAAEILQSEKFCNIKKAEARALIAQQQAAAQAIVAGFAEGISALKEAKNVALQALDKEAQQAATEIRLAVEKQSNHLDESKKQLAANLKKELESIESARDATLKNDGVDVDTVARLRSELAEVKKKRDRIAGFRQMVEDYTQFMADVWPKIDSLREAQKNHAAAVVAREKSLADLEKAFVARIAGLNTDQEKLEMERTRVDEDLRAIKNIREKLDDYMPDMQRKLEVDQTVVAMTIKTNALFDERRAAAKQVQEKGTEIRALFMKASNSSPCRFWTGARAELEAAGEDEMEGMLPRLVEWYLSTYKDSQGLLIQQAREFSTRLSLHRDELERFETGVRSFSNKLSRATDSTIEFGKLRDVRVRLETQTKGINHRKYLSTLISEHEIWRAQPGDNLPSKSFIDAVTNIANELPKSTLDEDAVRANLLKMLDIEITLMDGAVAKKIVSEQTMEDISSNGLSFLVLAIVFIGFINMIRDGAPVHVVWAIDELKDLSSANVSILLDTAHKNNITLCTAFPDVDSGLLDRLDYAYHVSANKQLQQIDPSLIGQGDDWLFSDESIAATEAAISRHANSASDPDLLTETKATGQEESSEEISLLGEEHV